MLLIFAQDCPTNGFSTTLVTKRKQFMENHFGERVLHFLNIANWFQLLFQTPKSYKATLSSKTPICLPSPTKVVVAEHCKHVSGKLTSVFLRKQKVAYVTWECDLDLMLCENTLPLKCVSLLLACSLPLSCLAIAGPLPLYVQCLKSIPTVMICSKQTEYCACGSCNRLHKLCFEVWPNRFWYAYANSFIALAWQHWQQWSKWFQRSK